MKFHSHASCSALLALGASLVLGACAAPAADAEPLERPSLADSCPRDAELLASLAQTARTCASDDACPAGAHCDTDAGRCTLACLPTAEDPRGGCPDGQSCSCYGRCDGSVLEAARGVRARLRLRSGTVLLPRAAGADRCQVVADVTFPDVHRPEPGDRIAFHAPPGIRLACAGGRDTADGCEVALETGEQQVAVAVHAAEDSGPGPWAIRYTSRALYPAAGAVTLARARADAGSPSHWQGTARLLGHAGEVMATVPLRASRKGTQVTLHDDSSILLPDGAVDITLGTPTRVACPAADAALVAAPALALQLSREDTSGALMGVATAALGVGHFETWHLALAADDAAVARQMPSALPGVDAVAADLAALTRGTGHVGGPPLPARAQTWMHRSQAVGPASAFYGRMPHHYGEGGRSRKVPVAFPVLGLAPALMGYESTHAASRAIAHEAFGGLLADQGLALVHRSTGRVNDLDALLAPTAGLQNVEARVRVPCIPNTMENYGSLRRADCRHLQGPRNPMGTHDSHCMSFWSDYEVRAIGPSALTAEQVRAMPVWVCPAGFAAGSEMHADAAEAALCFDPQFAADQHGMVSTGLSQAIDPLSDEPLCANGAPQRAFPLLRQQQSLQAADIAACLRDLDQDAPAAITDDTWKYHPSAHGPCFAPLPFYTALQAVLPATVDPQAGTMFARLLQQWLRAHVRVGEAYVRESTLRAMVGGEVSGAAAVRQLPTLPEAGAVVAELERGLQLVLSEPMLARISSLDGRWLATATYHANDGTGPRRPTPATVGLPVDALEAAASYLRVQGHVLSRPADSADEGPADVATRAATALRLAYGIRQLADDVYGRALEAARRRGDVLAWQARYVAACAEVDAAVRRVEMARDFGSDDWSTFGLDADDEVPLFARDVEGPNASFFASSDYLIDHVAVPAVAAARTTLVAEARGQWQGFLDSKLREDGQQDFVRLQFAAPIAAMCGIQQATPAFLEKLAVGGFGLSDCLAAAGSADDAPEHWRGAIGQAASAIVQARAGVSAARAELADQVEHYDRKMQWCGELQAARSQDLGLIAVHDAQITAMRTLKSIADTVTAFADAAGKTSLLDLFSAGLGPAGRLVSAGAQTVSIALQQGMSELEDTHRQQMTGRAFALEVRQCLSEADTAWGGFRGAVAKVDERTAGLRAAELGLSNIKDEALRLISDGTAIAQREQVRPRGTATYGQWLGSTAVRYAQELRAARRATFLALRASEYETQMTSSLRTDVLRARGPEELTRVLDEVLGQRLRRGINERRPQHHQVTVSLRDEALRLADQSAVPRGLRHGTAAARFSHHLASEAGAIYDVHGRLLGQGVTFDLPQLTSDQCAERLTRVGARLVGTFAKEAPIAAQLTIYKIGSFGSNWCAGRQPGDGPSMQWHALPRAELASAVHNSYRPIAADLTGYSVALVDARRDVTAGRFADANFRDGASEELAGQGIYGTYAVVFNPRDQALLGQIEDIVLRLDYVSVANSGAQPRQ